MNNSFKQIIVCTLISLSAFDLYAADSDVLEITAEQWAIPRHGERIIKMPAMKKLVKLWHNDPTQVIEISYPGGENGEIWLTELIDWLIALGIASDSIKTTVGSGSKDIIKLTVPVAGGIVK
ncbi:MAG: hypothetical protein OEY36_11120 [Gammaproteobacteria bacterium]|nr:hypothetical protein [Gammaproteobacteria bacterium]